MALTAYSKFGGTKKTPQGTPIPGEKQVQNNAGGYVYQLDDWKAFERFLILGSEGGTYYVKEDKHTYQNAVRTMGCIAQDGKRAVDLIVDVSDKGRAPKNDPAIFALALASAAKDPETRAYALAALPKVCRIPTHLFHFITFVKNMRGFGRGLRTALGKWYNDMPVEKLAYEMVKYQSRDGWSNGDLLRLSHPKTADPARHGVYRWVVDGLAEVQTRKLPIPHIVAGFELAKDSPTKELVQLIKDYNLSREMLPTEALDKPEVWEALLEKMPMTAMIRNLGNMSKCGLLKPLSSASNLIVERLHDEKVIRKARVHPIAVLMALKTYAQGHGMMGTGKWTPVPAVVDALDDAFYLAFENIEPTGKRILFGIDVSGSMGSPCAGTPLSCAEGAAAMALACAKTEKNYYIHGFTAGAGRSYYNAHSSDLGGFVDLGITPKMRLDQALKITRRMNFGATDCSIPMLYAEKNKLDVDAFVVITDCETWAGAIHPSQALRSYRQKAGIEAKEIVIGMTATNFTIADPNDPLTLDVVGFSTDVPQVVGEFIR